MELAPLTDRARWEALTPDAPFEHSWIYGAAAARMGAGLHRLVIGPPKAPLGVAQVITRGLGPVRLALAPRGVHWLGPEPEGAAAALRRGVPGLCWLLSAGGAGRDVAAGRTVAELRLDGDLRTGMAQKWRNRLNRAERQRLAVLVESGCPDWLIRAEMAERRRKRYRAHPPAWFRALHCAGRGAMETWAAYRDGAPVAGMCFIRHGRGISYLLGWTGAAGRETGAHNLLLHRAAAHAAARGSDRLHLGLADPVAAPGLTRFKTGAGAELVPIPPTRLLTPWSAPRDGAVAA